MTYREKEHCKFCLKYPETVGDIINLSEVKQMIDYGEIPVISLEKLYHAILKSKYMPEYKDIVKDFKKIDKFELRKEKMNKLFKNE